MWGCLAQGPISLAQRLGSWESREDRACLKTSWLGQRGCGGLEEARQGGGGGTLLKTSTKSPQLGAAWPRGGLSCSSSSPSGGVVGPASSPASCPQGPLPSEDFLPLAGEGKLGLGFASVEPVTDSPRHGHHQHSFRSLLETHLLALKGEAEIHQNNPRRRRGPDLGSPLEVGAAGICRPLASPPLGLGLPVWPGDRDMLPACASGPPPLPPPSSLPFQRHYKSNGLERKASKILKPSSIINADSKSPLRAFYIATVTKTRWWGCGSSPPHPTALGGIAAEPGPARPPPGHPPALPRSRGGAILAGETVSFLLKTGGGVQAAQPSEAPAQVEGRDPGPLGGGAHVQG